MGKVTVGGRVATHYCNVCGALWMLFDAMPGAPEGGWSLVSAECGPCCDNVSMGDQIRSLPAPAEDFGVMFVEAQPDRAPAPRVQHSRIITLKMVIDVTDSTGRTIYQDVEDILVHALRNHDRIDIGKDITMPHNRLLQHYPNTYRIDAHYAKDGVEFQISDEAAWGPR